MVWRERETANPDLLSIRSAERRLELLHDVVSIRSGSSRVVRQQGGAANYHHHHHQHPHKPFVAKIKEGIRIVIAWTFSNVGICVLVVGYLLLGAAMFQEIERGEGRRLSRIKQLRTLTVNRLWNITEKYNLLHPDNWTREVGQLVMEYQAEIVRAEEEEGYDGNDIPVDLWNYSGALLYSITVITTIGYGHIVPTTPVGKIMSIFYAVVGVPLFLLYLSNIGNIMAGSFKWTYSRICKCQLMKRRRSHRYRVSALPHQIHPGIVRAHHGPRGAQQTDLAQESVSAHSLTDSTVEDIEDYEDEEDGDEDEEEDDEDDELESTDKVAVPIILSLSVMVSYICGGAILFGEWEGWPFIDGFYFCFISLSTIGFGDMVPGKAVQPEGSEGDASGLLQVNAQFIFCSLYILLGMAVIAMCFSLMQEKVVRGVLSAGRKLGLVK